MLLHFCENEIKYFFNFFFLCLKTLMFEHNFRPGLSALSTRCPNVDEAVKAPKVNSICPIENNFRLP